MILKTGALPDLVIVDPHRMLPRFWATAWSLSTQGHALAENTRKTTLRHIDVFYSFCDDRYGVNSFDSAVSERDASSILRLELPSYIRKFKVSPQVNLFPSRNFYAQKKISRSEVSSAAPSLQV